MRGSMAAQAATRRSPPVEPHVCPDVGIDPRRHELMSAHSLVRGCCFPAPEATTAHQWMWGTDPPGRRRADAGRADDGGAAGLGPGIVAPGALTHPPAEQNADRRSNYDYRRLPLVRAPHCHPRWWRYPDRETSFYTKVFSCPWALDPRYPAGDAAPPPLVKRNRFKQSAKPVFTSSRRPC